MRLLMVPLGFLLVFGIAACDMDIGNPTPRTVSAAVVPGKSGVRLSGKVGMWLMLPPTLPRGSLPACALRYRQSGETAFEVETSVAKVPRGYDECSRATSP